MNHFLVVNGNQVIIDKNQLITYAAAAAGVIIVVAIITISAKMRKKNFIKTIPTNLKDIK